MAENAEDKQPNLHEIPATDSFIDHIQEESFVTLSNIPRVDDSPLSFRIPAVKNAYLDTSRIYLKFRLRVLESPDKVLTGDKSGTVSCINFLGATIFKNVEVFYENTLVYDSGNHYAYLYYLATLLHASDAAKSTYLTNALWYPDTAGSFDMTSALDDGNQGLSIRHSYINLSQEAEFYVRVFADPFNTDRLLLNNVDVNIRLTPHRPEFYIIQDGYAPPPVPPAVQGPKANLNLVIQITHAELFVPRVYIKEKALKEQEAALVRNPGIYPIVQSKVHYFKHLPNTVIFDSSVVTGGPLPTRIYVLLLDEKAYLGSFNTNPLKLGTFHLESIQVDAGGRLLPPDPLTMSWRNKQYTRAYMSLFEALASVGSKPKITRDDFAGGYFVSSFDLTPTHESGSDETYTVPQTGSLRLKMKFAQAPTSALSVLVIGEYEKLLVIDKDRKISITDPS